MATKLETLAREAMAEAAALASREREDAYRKAKSNVGRLLALGVLITCDDEFDRAMRYEYETRVMKDYGVDRAAAADMIDLGQAKLKVVRNLAGVVTDGETPAERQARHRAVTATLEGETPDGRICRHRTTKRETGVYFLGYFGTESGEHVARYACGRCNARPVAVSERPPERTSAANEASDLLRELAKDETGETAALLLELADPNRSLDSDVTYSRRMADAFLVEA